ncbi:hypothetical protein EJ06DRAFT_476197, partial [Trichodelitschia bisporula]
LRQLTQPEARTMFRLRPSSHAPLASLALLFIAWKLVLLGVALASPGEGYDSSTGLWMRWWGADTSPCTASDSGLVARLARRLAQRLVRWDAIYYTTSAQRGYVYEQEWAFGWGLTTLLGKLAEWLPLSSSPLLDVAYHGIFLANASHLVTVFVLYYLTLSLTQRHADQRIAFVTAALHIISPAGLFLAAPYPEAPFALLNFTGYLFYSHASSGDPSAWALKNDAYLIISGALFGLATTLRSNGLFCGVIMFYDAIAGSIRVLEGLGLIPTTTMSYIPSKLRDDVRYIGLRRLLTTVIAGVLVGLGFVGPQYIAWKQFCSGTSEDEVPVWCNRQIPSIYTWVQTHYWQENVGPFKYWTLSNLPLFLLATPTLLLMASSACLALTGQWSLTPPTVETHRAKVEAAKEFDQSSSITHRLALPQLVLAILALTSFHVQVITRLSSGYPLWYLFLATVILQRSTEAKGASWASWTVKWMIMYGLIQGALFAAFLPPA